MIFRCDGTTVKDRVNSQKHWKTTFKTVTCSAACFLGSEGAEAGDDTRAEERAAQYSCVGHRLTDPSKSGVHA
jgi:hypothetical protein